MRHAPGLRWVASAAPPAASAARAGATGGPWARRARPGRCRPRWAGRRRSSSCPWRHPFRTQNAGEAGKVRGNQLSVLAFIPASMTPRASDVSVSRDRDTETTLHPDSDSATGAESDLPPETEESDAAESESRQPDVTDEEAAQLRRGYLLRRFWHTGFRFWTTPGRYVAWLLS